MNDLETKIRQDKQTRTEPDSMNKSMSRRNFGKTLLTLTAGAILKSCTTPTTPDNDNNTIYEHKLKTNITYLHTGENATGEVKATRESDGTTFNGTINGPEINLGETTNQTENYTITLTGNNMIKRIFENIGITNNTLKTNVVNKNHIDWQWMIDKYMNPNNMNKTWEPKTIDVYFNEYNNQRLTTGQIQYIKKAIQDLQSWSMGYINQVNFHENGNKPYATEPPEGETWAFPDPEMGLGNITYPSDGDRVKSSVIFINEIVPGGACYSETLDGFIQENQNLPDDISKLGPIFAYLLNRPRGYDCTFKIKSSEERQKGIDSFSSLQAHAQTASVAQETSPEINPLGLGNTRKYERNQILIEPERKQAEKHEHKKY